eukprot:476338-Alexandrium_andersonii.AAC.1
MSASLVGSEMCIRDRVSSGGPSPSESETSMGERTAQSTISGATGRRRTVSYTHLTLPTICSV